VVGVSEDAFAEDVAQQDGKDQDVAPWEEVIDDVGQGDVAIVDVAIVDVAEDDGAREVGGDCTARALRDESFCDDDPCVRPVCGDDKKTYGDPCAASRAGTSSSGFVTCVAPAGYFQCAQVFCRIGIEYCARTFGYLSRGHCQALPATCLEGGAPSCSCVNFPEPCGRGCACNECDSDGQGNVPRTRLVP
jgi:hypothetical protein